MHTEEVVCTIKYTVFDVGDRVRLKGMSSSGSDVSDVSLSVYTVAKFIHPLIPHELCGVVFLEGRVTGIPADMLTLARESGKLEGSAETG